MNKSIVSGIVVVLVIAAVIVFAMNQRADESVPAPIATSTSPLATSTTPVAQVSYVLSDVALHATASNCWSAVNGKVYDLTSWISKHPGGQRAILGICGRDGSVAFNGQHGGQQKQADQLETFYIGELKSNQ